MGIHYDYKSKRGERAVLKQAKREARLAKKKEKRKNVVEESNRICNALQARIRKCFWTGHCG